MEAAPSADRRQHPRHPLATSVEFYHAESQRSFPGRCVDISDGGMMMYVPANTPIQPGQCLRLTMASISRPEFAGFSGRPVDASVVRVERKALLATGHVAVAVRFAP